MLGRKLPGRGVAPVIDKLAAAAGKVGHKGNARCLPLQYMDTARVDAVARKAVQHALAKIIRPHAANEAGRASQPRHAVNVDARVAAGEWADKRARVIHGLVELGAHDLDKHSANADNVGVCGHGSILRLVWWVGNCGEVG